MSADLKGLCCQPCLFIYLFIYLLAYLNNFVISRGMVQEKLEELNPVKTPGPDGWYPVLLIGIADMISLPLSILFQKSLNEGILPSQWLKACITAIHQKGSKINPENYIPISITSIVCKIMESIVRDKVVSHMEFNDLFSNNQHGFVPHRNCMTNLLTCMELWTKMVEKGLPIDIIYIYTDFAKSFDPVPHQPILQKLMNIGITGNTSSWVEAFLSGRSQCVKVENEYSSRT